MKKHIVVDTGCYYSSHLKKPKGRGGWMFQIGGHVNGETVCFSGTYTESLKRAKERARATGAGTVVVLP
jgi:hypothetical protein